MAENPDTPEIVAGDLSSRFLALAAATVVAKVNGWHVEKVLLVSLAIAAVITVIRILVAAKKLSRWVDWGVAAILQTGIAIALILAFVENDKLQAQIGDLTTQVRTQAEQQQRDDKIVAAIKEPEERRLAERAAEARAQAKREAEAKKRMETYQPIISQGKAIEQKLIQGHGNNDTPVDSTIQTEAQAWHGRAKPMILGCDSSYVSEFESPSDAIRMTVEMRDMDMNRARLYQTVHREVVALENCAH